ncbi:tyrosine-protein phosphatase [Lactobacillus sp. ESL0684]|uniref:tyrosine-protein phosphatase n=1 Tax=Lactobacillus sp. ESL0684 TaxID=2983213 RepID=UPI0023F8C364|nr:tyrosine-protein phosphatase [Lactobacillus sp. ESL0684]WEV43194.1 tyrosine-protein phosphatase [Lactobacillus sp. ESL0684]
MGNQPQSQKIDTVVSESQTGAFQIKLPRSQLPKYFIIRSDSFTTNIFAERVLPLDNAINLRDMGGYRANDGRFVRWGKLFRGDQLTNLNSEDQQILTNYGIQTIVDYRSPHERQIHPNKFIPTVTQILNCDPQSSFSEAAASVVDLKGENEKLVQSLKNGEIAQKYLNDRGENVIESYQDLVISSVAQKAYGSLLKAVVRQEALPILHHCRGGKDRTGFGSMLVLLLLNVQEDEIVKDYMLTKVIRKDRNHLKYELYHELVQEKAYLDYLMAMIDTRESYIKAALNKIRELFGTPENYLQEHFGISNTEIQQVRDFYLEKGNSNE